VNGSFSITDSNARQTTPPVDFTRILPISEKQRNFVTINEKRGGSIRHGLLPKWHQLTQFTAWAGTACLDSALKATGL
jgi:hypothetical protein